MVNVTLNRLGLNYNAGAAASSSTNPADKKFLRIYGGMILKAYDQAITTEGKHMVRNIKRGKTAQFPVIGYATAGYHTPGENILDNANGYLSNIDHDEINIGVDRKLLAADTIDDIDELKLHFDVRKTFADKFGSAIAEQRDLNIYRVIRMGANASADQGYLGQPAGTTTSVGTWDSSVADMVDAFYDMRAAFSNKRVPIAGRYAAVNPTDYTRLLNNAGTPGVVVNKDYSSGNGDFAKAEVLMVAGFRIVETTNLPATDWSLGAYTDNQPADAEYVNAYTGTLNNANLRALFWHPTAIGEVRLRNMRAAITWHEENQCWLMNNSAAVGAGVLRQEACGAVTV